MDWALGLKKPIFLLIDFSRQLGERNKQAFFLFFKQEKQPEVFSTPVRLLSFPKRKDEMMNISHLSVMTIEKQRAALLYGLLFKDS